MKIVFVVENFPATAQTFMIDQIAGLLDRDIDVEIFSLTKGTIDKNISQKFFDYKMSDRTRDLSLPKNLFTRILIALPKVLKIFCLHPNLLFKIFNFSKYGGNASSLKLLFWVEPWLGEEFDLVHCHFGTTANKFLLIKEILNLDTKIVTTFYGYDVSNIFQEKGDNYYDKLKKVCNLFFVMSQDMKNRVVNYGFEADKVVVLPVGIEVEKYDFRARSLQPDETIRMVSVGRFVEKKGFDDLLKALALVKNKTQQKFHCDIIGGGPLDDELQILTDKMSLRDVVTYHGYMSIDKILDFFKDKHLFIQPSKTAKNGDME